MVYKKYHKKDGRTFGPYYYESYRHNGKVKKRYIGDELEYKNWLKSNQKDCAIIVEQLPVDTKKDSILLKLFFYLFIIIFIFLFIYNSAFIFSILYGYGNLIGWSVSQEGDNNLSLYASYSPEIVEQQFDQEDSLVMVKSPENFGGEALSKNKNKIIDFELKETKVRLYFDVINYSNFMEEIKDEMSYEEIAEYSDEEEVFQDSLDILNESNDSTQGILNESDSGQEVVDLLENESDEEASEPEADNSSGEEEPEEEPVQEPEEEPVQEPEEEPVQEPDANPGITGNLIKSGITGKSVENINEADISNEAIKEKFDELNEKDSEKIIENSIEEAKDFEIVFDEEKAKEEKVDYKWGYQTRLNSYNFMAKIEVTSTDDMEVLDQQTIRIGNKLLSFKDLINEGYNVSIQNPAFDMEVVEPLPEQINELAEEIISENSTSANESEEVISNDAAQANPVEPNESEVSEPQDSEPNETDAADEPNEPSELDDVLDNITGAFIKNSYLITGKSVFDFGTKDSPDDLKYKNNIVVYIERDFSQAISPDGKPYEIGDLIYLDPALLTVQVGAPSVNLDYITGRNNVTIIANGSTTAGNVSVFIDWNNSLISWWGAGSSDYLWPYLANWTDDYMRRNNGTPNGFDTSSDYGYFAKGFAFDGADYIALPVNQIPDSNEPRTISLWMYAYNYDNSTMYNMFGTSATAKGKSFMINWENRSISLAMYEHRVITPYQKLSSYQWYHVVVRVPENANSTSDPEIWINATKQTLLNATCIACPHLLNTSYASGFTMGGDSSYPTQMFVGVLDDVMVFNRSLSQAEIIALYANSSTKLLNNSYNTTVNQNYTFVAYVQDTNGSVNYSQFATIYKDISGPTLTILNPQNNSYYNGVVTVNSTSADNYNVSVLMDYGVVSWWRMDDLNSSGGVVDYMGRHNGTAVNQSVKTQSGYFGDAFSFDGDGDYINFGNPSLLNFGASTDFTLSAWFKTNNLQSNFDIILSKADVGGTYDRYRFIVNSNENIQLNVNDGTNNLGLAGTTLVNDSKWHHAVGVFDRDGNATLYVDGLIDATNNITGIGDIDTPNSFFIGAENWSADMGWFNGSIDNVIVWNRTLSALEVAALHANTSSKYINTTFFLPLGTSNLRFYAQDQAGNLVTQTIYNLTFDVNYPIQTIYSPANTSYSTTTIIFNATTSETGSGSLISNSNNSLVSWWRMDDLNSSGGVVDYMNRYNGTPINQSFRTDAGYFGKGFSFDGINDYISLGNTAGLQVPSKTISFWAKPLNSNQCTSSICIFFSSSSSQYYLAVRNTTTTNHNLYVSFLNSTGNQKTVSSGTSLVKLNEWHMYSVVFNVTGDTVNVSFYKDGVYNQSGNYSEGHSSSYGSAFVLGALSSTTAYDYNGSLDDVIFFNKSLTPDEIKAIYNSTAINHNETYPAGSYTYTVYSQDRAGNVNSSSNMFTIDTTIPTQTIYSPTNTTYRTSNINFNATSSDSGTGGLIPNLNNSLVSWWRMDEVNSTGLGAAVYDYMGRNNGTAANQSKRTDQGYFGKGFEFDGDGDYINMTSSTSLKPTQNLSWGLWFYAFQRGLVIGDSNGMLSNVNGTSGYSGYNIFNSYNDYTYCAVGNGSGSTLTWTYSLNPFSQAAWHHVMCIYNSTDLIQYFDGVYQSKTSLNISLPYSSHNPVIGRYFTNYHGYYFNGTIDDAMVYNKSLTSDEVRAIYNATAIYHNETLSDGPRNYKIYSQDRAGNVNTSNVTFTVGTGNITSCGDLISANTVYTLRNNITGVSTTCLNVLADNITINGNGFTLDGTDVDDTYGVYSLSRKNTTVKNFKNITDFYFGIWLNGTSNSSISNLTSGSSQHSAISLDYCSNISITNVTTLSSFYSGLRIRYTSKSNIRNITSNLNDDGVFLVYSDNNTLDKMTITSNNGFGLGVSVGSDGNNITNFTIRNSSASGPTGSGIWIYEGANNSFSSGYIIDSLGYGVYFYSTSSYEASNNFFKDMVISGTTLNDTYLKTDNSGSAAINNTFLNVTYSDPEGATNTGDGGAVELLRKWYYTAYVNDSFGAVISSVDVKGYNLSGISKFNLTTNASGVVPKYELLDYSVNVSGIRNYSSMYNVYANKSAYQTINQTWNLTLKQNTRQDFTLTQINLTACTTLNSAGTTYVLLNDISGATGTCFNITADNITLNGNGKNISGSSVGNDAAVNVSGRKNVTVKNFNYITQFHYGVYFSGTNNSQIQNLTASLNQFGAYSVGVYLENSSNNVLTNITANSNSLYGLQIGGRNNTLTNITANSNSFSGVVAWNLNNSIFSFITTSGGGVGIDFDASSNNSVSNFSVSSTSTSGIHVSEGSNNSFVWGYVTNSQWGVYIRSYGYAGPISSNNLFKNMWISGCTSDVLITTADPGSQAINNTFWNVTYSDPDNLTNMGDGGALQLIRRWDYNAYVGQAGASYLANANITISSPYDSIGVGLTGATGWYNGSITDYTNNNGTITNYTEVRAISGGLVGYNSTYTGQTTGFTDTITIDKTNPVVTVDSQSTSSGANMQNYIYVKGDGNDAYSDVSTVINYDNSLVSWWRMDDISGTTVEDYMNRNDGTATGNAKSIDAGYLGKGFAFDGVDDYINLGNIAGLKVASKTINFWAKPYSTSSCTSYICALFSASDNNYYVGISNSTATNHYLYVSFANSTGGQKTNSSGASLVKMNEWHMYTVVFNVSGNNVYTSYYRDGILNETDYAGQGHYTTYGTAFLIGALTTASSYDYMGLLDDMMFFNRSLSASEVLGLYANSTQKYTSTNFTNQTEGAHPYTIYSQDRAGNVNTNTSRPALGVPLRSGWNTISLIMNDSVSSSTGDRNVSLTGELSAGEWNLIGYSSAIELNIDNIKFKNTTQNTFTQAWQAGEIAPYLAYFDSTEGADGAYKYVAPTAFGGSFEHTFRERTAYWAKSYKDGNLTFPNAGGTFVNATHKWSDVRVDNGTSEKNLTDAATAGWITSNRLYYYNQSGDGWEYVDSQADYRNTFRSWEGLFTYVDNTDLTFVRKN